MKIVGSDYHSLLRVLASCTCCCTGALRAYKDELLWERDWPSGLPLLVPSLRVLDHFNQSSLRFVECE